MNRTVVKVIPDEEAEDSPRSGTPVSDTSDEETGEETEDSMVQESETPEVKKEVTQEPCQSRGPAPEELQDFFDFLRDMKKKTGSKKSAEPKKKSKKSPSGVKKPQAKRVKATKAPTSSQAKKKAAALKAEIDRHNKKLLKLAA